VDETPDDKAQTNFTDPELHIMRTNNKGWEYCGNAQASVDAAHQIIVACDVTAESNDKQQAEPMAQLTVASLAQAGIVPPKDATGATQKIPATYDSGYYSAAAAAAVEQLGFDPYMATERQRHHAPEAESADRLTTAQERMGQKYGHRKGVPCTRGAKSSWNPCLARSKKDGVSVGSCCVAWTTSVVSGGWCV
jgi:hypothetical protein